MKNRMAAFLLLVTPSLAIGSERETLYRGLGMHLVSSVDAMTDKRSCALFVELTSIYLAIYGANDFTIWAQEDPHVLFASDAKQLIRVGKAAPFVLNVQTKRNGLRLKDPATAKSVIRALARGESVKLRYVDWPSHDDHDVEIRNPNVAYVYAIGVKRCGWKDLGVPSALAPVTLEAYEPKDADSEGYASVNPAGNTDLKLAKGFTKSGGGCYIEAGIHRTFGRAGDEWRNGHIDTSKQTKLVIRNQAGEIAFEDAVPDSYGYMGTSPWPAGEKAARAAWENSPDGSLSLEGMTEERVSLYGFRELWKWGEAHGCWSSID